MSKIILDEGGGALLVGEPYSVPQGVTVRLEKMTQYDAMSADDYPWAQTLVRAIWGLPAGFCFKGEALLDFRIDWPMPAGSGLPVYILDGSQWVKSAEDAVVGSTCYSAYIPVNRLSGFSLFRPAVWLTMDYQGSTLVYRRDGIPVSQIRCPLVLASGKTTDQAVIEEVMRITGRTYAAAVELLKSFDDTDCNVVEVLESQQTLLIAVRYWGPDEKIGRWFAPSEFKDCLLTPDEARRYYALPSSNNSYNVTMFQLKKGTRFIFGVCADMRWNPIFGPHAIGGGFQFYGPDTTKLVDGSVEWNPDVIKVLSELRATITTRD